MSSENVILFNPRRSAHHLLMLPDGVDDFVAKYVQELRAAVNTQIPIAVVEHCYIDHGIHGDGSGWASVLIEIKLSEDDSVPLVLGVERGLADVYLGDDILAAGLTGPELLGCMRTIVSAVSEKWRNAWGLNSGDIPLGFSENLLVHVKGAAGWFAYQSDLSRMAPVLNMIRSNDLGQRIPVLRHRPGGLCLEPLNFGFVKDQRGDLQRLHPLTHHSVGRKCATMLSAVEVGGNLMRPTRRLFVGGMWRPDRSGVDQFVILSCTASHPIAPAFALQPFIFEGSELLNFLDPRKPLTKSTCTPAALDRILKPIQ